MKAIKRTTNGFPVFKLRLVNLGLGGLGMCFLATLIVALSLLLEVLMSFVELLTTAMLVMLPAERTLQVIIKVTSYPFAN